jgi:hypothetical protein
MLELTPTSPPHDPTISPSHYLISSTHRLTALPLCLSVRMVRSGFKSWSRTTTKIRVYNRLVARMGTNATIVIKPEPEAIPEPKYRIRTLNPNSNR